jgi:exosome complex RNA-binding protein Csl4
MVLAHFMENREKQEHKEKGIIRVEDSQWPREFVRQQKENRNEDDIIRPKVIKFADEHCL